MIIKQISHISFFPQLYFLPPESTCTFFFLVSFTVGGTSDKWNHIMLAFSTMSLRTVWLVASTRIPFLLKAE